MSQEKHDKKRLNDGLNPSSEGARSPNVSKKGWGPEGSPDEYIIIEPEVTGEVFAQQETGFRKKSITSELSEMLQRDVQYTPNGGEPITATNQTFMLQRVMMAAVLGDKDAIKWITDRVEGTAIQRQLIQNIDIISEVVQILERLIKDPILMKQIIYEFRHLAVRTDPNKVM